MWILGVKIIKIDNEKRKKQLIATQAKEVKEQLKHDQKHGRICFYKENGSASITQAQGNKTILMLLLMLTSSPFSR